MPINILVLSMLLEMTKLIVIDLVYFEVYATIKPRLKRLFLGNDRHPPVAPAA